MPLNRQIVLSFFVVGIVCLYYEYAGLSLDVFVVSLNCWLLYLSVSPIFGGKSINIVMYVGGLSMYVFPFLGGVYNEIDLSVVFFYLYSICCYVFCRFFPCDSKDRSCVRLTPGLLFSILLISSTLASILVVVWVPGAFGFYAVTILTLDRIVERRCVNIGVSVSCSFFPILVMLSGWSGYGRLHVATVILLPFMILFRRNLLKINHFFLFVGVMAASIVAVVVRFGSFDRPEQFGGDSAVHHLEIMTTLLRDGSLTSLRFDALFGQLLLSLLGWFPRQAWASKPFGLGAWFVDEYLGREGFDENFSVSLGFWGEHLFLMSEFWVASGFFSLVFFILFAHVLMMFFSEEPVVLLIYNINLLSLIWGGMATFGSRVWWMLLPLLVFLMVEKAMVHDKRMLR